jgi:hypothetical protein
MMLHVDSPEYCEKQVALIRNNQSTDSRYRDVNVRRNTVGILDYTRNCTRDTVMKGTSLRVISLVYRLANYF